MLTRGLYQIYTGDSKGKTTAAVGLAVRAHGAGLRVCFVQFIKGGAESSELPVLRSLGIPVVRPARESAGVMRGTVSDEDIRCVGEAWAYAANAIAGGEWDVVIMDELHIACKYKLLDPSEVLEVITHRPPHVEVVTTGRAAPDALCAAADLITEMRQHKHPFQQGIAARKGIEF